MEAIYLFPSVNFLPRVTLNLMTFLGRALIIIPWRPTAPWFPALRPRSSIHNLLEPPFQIVQGEIINTLSTFSEPWVALIFSRQSFERTIPLSHSQAIRFLVSSFLPTTSGGCLAILQDLAPFLTPRNNSKSCSRLSNLPV